MAIDDNDIISYEEENGYETESGADFSPLSREDVSKATLTATDWTTETLIAQINKGNILLDPDYQRRDAWNKTIKSAFIESIFLGFPIPQIVLAEQKNQRGKYIVLDGKQRLLSLRQFVSRENDPYNSFRLTELDILTSMNGKTYLSMKEDIFYANDIDAFDNSTIRTVIIKNWPNETFLYELFLRLNTGSLKLSPQELRQALHPGKFVKYVDEYSGKSPAMRAIFKKPTPDFRMRDAELLVRYIAFSLFFERYNGNLKVFLDDTCETLNKEWENMYDTVASLCKDFEEAHKAIVAIFGSNAYRKWNMNENYEPRFNRAVLDIMMYVFKFPEIRAILVQNRESVENTFKELCNNNNIFRTSLETTTKSTRATYNRVSLWAEAISRISGQTIGVPNIISNEPENA